MAFEKVHWECPKNANTNAVAAALFDSNTQPHYTSSHGNIWDQRELQTCLRLHGHSGISSVAPPDTRYGQIVIGADVGPPSCACVFCAADQI